KAGPARRRSRASCRGDFTGVAPGTPGGGRLANEVPEPAAVSGNAGAGPRNFSMAAGSDADAAAGGGVGSLRTTGVRIGPNAGRAISPWARVFVASSAAGC